MGKLLKRAIGRILVIRDGFWFVDIPRTSSSSIRSELGQQFGRAHGKRKVMQAEFARPQLFSDHLTARQMRSIIGPRHWQKLFTFTMVRNPWDRVHSMYHYRRKIAQNLPAGWTFDDYVCALVEADERSAHFALDAYRLGAADYVTGEDGEVIVSYIARFERRSEDLQHIAQTIHCEALGQRVLQYAAPKGRHYSEFYSDKTRELIARRYAQDVELFHYSFEQN